MMKPGEVCHGFEVKSVTDLPEIPARMVRMEYRRNGADLVWLDREDENKTFAIAFKTLPSDDTGVAHIIEHSVLCGSEKYPVKEPFVDLLKSSLATFLNAMTWPDKTAYPVSTRNDRDFLNLSDVYLDAVFNPLSVKSDWAYRQEGWHYEYDGTNLTRNGVVYSEMKGAFANPDSVAFHETMRLLFPDNTYGVESGGSPASIPDLTWEAYKAFHRRFYHPSNARIFLDGRVDIDAILAKLDSYLAPYDRLDVKAEIPMQRPVSRKATVKYESPDETDKVILSDGWVFGTYADRERQLAFTVIAEVLTGSNEAPLKKALLDAGLCEDVELAGESIQQPVAMLLLRNTSSAKAADCRRVVRETLEKVCREGLDRRQIAAQLDNLEFRVREKDSGTIPRGLGFMEAALDSWLYGGDPADGFRYEALFASLRAKIETGGFEKYLREILLDNPHHAELTLVPSKTLGEERRRADEAALAALKAKMSAQELADIAERARKLKEHQSAPDRPEDSARLPRLAVKDIPLEGTPVVREISSSDGVTVIRPKVGAGGIFYLDLCFSLAGFSDDELLAVPFLAITLGDLATERYPLLELRSELDGKLGRISFSLRSCETGPRFVVHVSALKARRDEALRLLGEVLLRTKYDDAKAIADLLAQAREDVERAVQTEGHKFAMRRAAAGLSEPNRVAELFTGFDQLRWLQKRCAEKNAAALGRTLAALARRVFARDGLVVSLTDNMPAGDALAFAEAWPKRDAAAPRPAAVPPAGDGAGARCATGGEGFEIAAAIGFAGTAAHLPPGVPFCGSQLVGARILTLDYLWNEIRVKGGAYGMALSVLSDGDVQTMTYRDPDPARSLGCFAGMGAALEAFLAKGSSFENYQVATVAKTEPYRSPRVEARRAVDLYLDGRTPEDLARIRREILSVTREDLAAFAKTLEAVEKSPRVCVVAGKALLPRCGLRVTESVR